MSPSTKAMLTSATGCLLGLLVIALVRDVDRALSIAPYLVVGTVVGDVAGRLFNAHRRARRCP